MFLPVEEKHWKILKDVVGGGNLSHIFAFGGGFEPGPHLGEKRGMNVFVLISHGSPTSVTSGELFCICSLVFEGFYFAFARFCMETFLMCVPTKVRVVQHELEALLSLG